MSELKIVGPEYVAQLLGIDVRTVSNDVKRKPDSLPPRLVIPGRNGLRWIEADVLAWFNSLRTPVKGKVGRPSLQKH